MCFCCKQIQFGDYHDPYIAQKSSAPAHESYSQNVPQYQSPMHHQQQQAPQAYGGGYAGGYGGGEKGVALVANVCGMPNKAPHCVQVPRMPRPTPSSRLLSLLLSMRCRLSRPRPAAWPCLEQAAMTSVEGAWRTTTRGQGASRTSATS